jgi:hypothetical protein
MIVEAKLRRAPQVGDAFGMYDWKGNIQHKNCHGFLIMVRNSTKIINCNKCHREWVDLDTEGEIWDKIKDFAYTEITRIVDTAKLDPVYKLIDAKGYTTTTPLDEEGLLRYYGYVSWEIKK